MGEQSVAARLPSFDSSLLIIEIRIDFWFPLVTSASALILPLASESILFLPVRNKMFRC